jgi:hypothetical protein
VRGREGAGYEYLAAKSGDPLGLEPEYADDLSAKQLLLAVVPDLRARTPSAARPEVDEELVRRVTGLGEVLDAGDATNGSWSRSKSSHVAAIPASVVGSLLLTPCAARRPEAKPYRVRMPATVPNQERWKGWSIWPTPSQAAWSYSLRVSGCEITR